MGGCGPARLRPTPAARAALRGSGLAGPAPGGRTNRSPRRPRRASVTPAGFGNRPALREANPSILLLAVPKFKSEEEPTRGPGPAPADAAVRRSAGAAGRRSPRGTRGRTAAAPPGPAPD